jgi:hypothetical protein
LGVPKAMLSTPSASPAGEMISISTIGSSDPTPQKGPISAQVAVVEPMGPEAPRTLTVQVSCPK